MKPVLMLQGTYGYFGLTAAMFRRCAEFKKFGINTISISLDFMPNLYDIKKIFTDQGKIEESSLLINPFLELSECANEWALSRNTSEIKQSLFLLSTSKENNYYFSDGNLFNEKYIDVLNQIKVPKQKYNDVTVHEDIFLNGTKIQERFYAKNGLCLAIKDINPLTGKQKRFLVFDYLKGLIKEYKNNYEYSVFWLDEKLKKYNDNNIEPIVICDGPYTAKKLADIKSRAKKIYVIHHNHKNDQGEIEVRDQWNLENASTFDAIVVLTPQQLTDLQKDFPKLDNLYNISNFTKVKPISIRTGNKKNKLIFVGQLFDKKGLPDAIRVVSVLRNQYKVDVYLDVFGSHVKDTKKAINHYQSIATKENVEDYVFFKGYSADILKEMSESVCLVFPSQSEVQPLTILEAMSLGTPVVSYDCKYGPRAMIDDGLNGAIVPLGACDEMAARIYKLLSQPSLREQWSINAIEKAKTMTSSDLIFEKWNNLFLKLEEKESV